MEQNQNFFKIVSAKLDKFVTKGFSKYGKIVAKYPWPFFILPIIATIICATGFARFTVMNNILETFIPPGTESSKETWVRDHFFDGMTDNITMKKNEKRVRFIQLDITVKGEEDIYGNRTDLILLAIDYFSNKFSIRYQGTSYRYRDICQPFCALNDVAKSFLKMFKESDNEPNSYVQLTYPIMKVFGNRIHIGNHIFGVKQNKTNGYIISYKMVHTLLIYIQQNGSEGYLQKWEDAVVAKILKNDIPHLNLVTGHPNGVFAEVLRAARTALPLIGYCGLLLLAFSIISNLKSDFNRSKVWESVAGLLCPIMALITTFGLLLFLGLAYHHLNAISLFLVLAIGVDDMYIMLHAWHLSGGLTDDAKLNQTHAVINAAEANGFQTDPHTKQKGKQLTNGSMTVVDRISDAIAHAGPSITTTSLTNALSFGIGILSPTPAIKTFCLYTSISILMDYLFQITFFAAVMAFSGYRESANRNSFICCISKHCKFTFMDKTSLLYQKFLDVTSKILQTNLARIILLVVMVFYWTIAIYGISQATVDISMRKLVLYDSPLYRLDEYRNKYFLKESNSVMIYILNPGNLEKKKTQQQSIDFVQEFEKLPRYINGSTALWLRQYKNHLSYFNSSEDFFSYEFLDSFLETGNNEMWRRHLNFDSSYVYKWSFTLSYRDLEVWYERAKWYKQLRAICKMNQYTHFNASIYSWNNYGTDQIEPLISTTRNLIFITVAVMVIVCFLFVPDLSSVICAVACVISINVGVIGYLMLWSVDLDPISMAALLMAIGFSVDYTAHMSFHFFKSQQKESQYRLLHVYKSIAWPMIQAACSTLICACLMSFHRSYMIRTFTKTVFLAVTIGVTHGLVVLPVMLTVKPFHCRKVNDA